MLRYIVPVSLATTACVTLIPALKTNAATLTAIPSGEIQKKPGDSIEYTFVFTPTLNRVATLIGWTRQFDNTELSPLNPMSPIELLVSLGDEINNTTTIARGTFNVLTPVKGGTVDARISILYEEEDASGKKITGLALSATGADVVPVPEPLTMLSAATALGYGVLFKRKYSQKKEK